jgi:hypothetical protein
MVSSALNKVDAQVYSDFLMEYDTKETLQKDFKLVIGSFVVLFLSFCLGLPSIRLAVVFEILVFLSIGASICVSRGIFGVAYLT